MDIRALDVNELWLCSQFGEDFHNEKLLADDFSFEAFHQHWTAFYQQEIGVILGLFDDKDQLIGGIGGMVGPDLTSGKIKLYELFWYVDRDKRHSTGRWPLRLVYRLRAWGKSKGATGFRMIHLLLPGETPSSVALADIYIKVLHMQPREVCFEGPIEGKE